jgi:hypothetical protein
MKPVKCRRPRTDIYAMTTFLARFFGFVFLVSLFVFIVTWWRRDELPQPDFYDAKALKAPRQVATERKPFRVEAGDQRYEIEPLFDYALDGVVVSYHDADSVADIWHHGAWQDYLNVRDLCVIWGDNVRSGVYQDMDFRNDSWTCWAYWPDMRIGARFRMDELSNNHLLADDPLVKKAMMSARPGDHIRFKGMLARYRNPANGFNRGTSTTRDDTGNGACETIYVTEFEVVSPANGGLRSLHTAAKWIAGLSLTAFLISFVAAPVRAIR